MSPSEIGAEDETALDRDASVFEREMRDRAHDLCERVGEQCLSCTDCVTDADAFDVMGFGEVASVRMHASAWCRRGRAEFATDEECDGWEELHE